jgi:ATP-dependent DNA ligase
MARATTAVLSMEARQVEELPRGQGWQYEPKWDGFRCLAAKTGTRVELTGRSGKSLSRYFPDIVEALAALLPARFILDGELVIPVGGALSFDALQLRLHPSAKRVGKLAREAPALMMAFDLLQSANGSDLRARPLAERRVALERLLAFFGEAKSLRLSPATRRRSVAVKWLARAGGELDGVVAKRLDEPYRAGERAMLKIKSRRTADCVVGGFRYASKGRTVGSLLLGLYDDAGRLNHVGFTSVLANVGRGTLTHELEALRGEPGFTGDAPGGPSRWSTERSGEWQPLKPRLVVEVQYDQVSGGRFRHGTKLLRWRPDKSPRQCLCDQLQREVAPSRLMRQLINARKRGA